MLSVLLCFVELALTKSPKCYRSAGAWLPAGFRSGCVAGGDCCEHGGLCGGRSISRDETLQRKTS